jgi:acetyl-CoA synthetase
MAKASAATEPIQALLKEGRKFPPPREFAKNAVVRSAAVHREAARDPVRFWGRLLRDIAEGRALGDTTTLADPNVVATLKKKYEEE